MRYLPRVNALGSMANSTDQSKKILCMKDRKIVAAVTIIMITAVVAMPTAAVMAAVVKATAAVKAVVKQQA